MLALTLDQATNIGIAIVVVFLVGALGAAWLMQTIVQKAIAVLVLGLLAFAVWSQRSALQDCADKVRTSFSRAGTDVELQDTDCEFFGLTVTVSDPRRPES